MANNSEPERALLFLSTLTARGLTLSECEGFPLCSLQGSESLPACFAVPTGRQPRLRTVIRYHSLPPSPGLVDPDTTACPSGCWAAVASFSSRIAQLLKVHAPSNAFVRICVRVLVCLNHLRVMHDIIFTQAQEKKPSFYLLQQGLICMFRNEQCEPIFMQWKPNEVSYLKAIGHIYTLRSVSACLHLLLILLKS